jgi:hypothetical protein
MLLAADGDYRKVGNGTTTRALHFVSYPQVPPLEQPLAPRPRQVPKGVRALLLKRFRNGLHDGRAQVRGNMRYCSFQPVCRS